jgi:1-deoxy-D-xylulose-5-phosphate synthase
MLYTGLTLDQPSAVRYPRGAGPGVPIEREMRALPVGKAELRRWGKDVAILAFGAMLRPALAAGEALDATVVNMRFVKPLDAEMVERIAADHHLIVTVEEHQVLAGAGSAVCEALSRLKSRARVLLLGLPDRFIDHGDPAKLLSSLGLDAQGIESSIRKALSE